MIPEKNKITQGQLMFFVIQSQVGVGILSLPYKLQASAKGGAWISALIAGLAVQIIILILCALCKQFPSDTLYSFLPKITGKFLGNLLCFAYIGYYLLSAGAALGKFADVVGKWVLQETPRWALLLLTLLTCMYLAKENIRVIARLFVLSTFTIIVMVILSLMGYVRMNFSYIFPITEAGWGKIIKGANDALFPLTGYENILVIYPFVEGKSGGKLKAVSLANMVVTLFYTFEVFTSLIIFSPAVMPEVSEPLLYMLKGFSFQVINRIDLIFLSLWIFVVTTSLVAWTYVASVGFGHFFHRGEHKKAVPYALFILFILGLIAQDPAISDLYDRMVAITHYSLIIVLPLILLCLAYFLRKGAAEIR
jgi:spore germination protein (amino acid permease)